MPPKRRMRAFSNEEMRSRVGAIDTVSAEHHKESNEKASLGIRSFSGYRRDFELLMDWSVSIHIQDLKEAIFFTCMEALIGTSSKSRIENFRSAVVFRQKADMNDGKWTQQDGFLIRFKGLLKRADVAYKLGQANGTIPKTRRGTATIDKIGETMDHCEEIDENEYATGFWIAYNALLRHKELWALTDKSYRWKTDGTAQVRVI